MSRITRKSQYNETNKKCINKRYCNPARFLAKLTVPLDEQNESQRYFAPKPSKSQLLNDKNIENLVLHIGAKTWHGSPQGESDKAIDGSENLSRNHKVFKWATRTLG